MKTQVVVIHGGDAFEKYEDYLENLQTKEVSLEKVRSIGWKANLGKDLGEDFDVLLLKMPNGQNARYNEWKIWFERFIPLFNEEIILVGHSLGAIFLIKYFSENVYPKKIKATILVGAPYNTLEFHPLVDFTITTPLNGFIKQSGETVFYHSKDDKNVPFENMERYKEKLPNAVFNVFEDRGHFNDESFPEIVELIKTFAS